MRYKFYREHKYVSFALNDLERLIARTNFKVKTQIEDIRKKLHAVVQMLKGHAHYENTCLHELLKKKGSLVYEQIEKEHQHYDDELNALQEMLKEVLECSNQEKREKLGYQFYLIYRKFVGENLIHLHEEETIILPELQRLYSDEEMRQVEFATYRKMSSHQLIEMMEVLFPHMNSSDKEAFLTDIKDSVPRKFIKAWKGIQRILDSQEQAVLSKKFSVRKK